MKSRFEDGNRTSGRRWGLFELCRYRAPGVGQMLLIVGILSSLEVALLTRSAAQTGVAFEGGVALSDGASAFLAGLRASSASPGGAGIDVAVSTLPQGWAEGVFNLLCDLDVDVRVRLSEQAQLSIRGGGSGLLLGVFVSEGGGGAAGGLNMGAGLILRMTKGTSFRVDYVRRKYFNGGEQFGLSSATFGIAVSY